MRLGPILGQLRNRRGDYDPNNPFSHMTPAELRRRMEYERNNPDEFRQTIMPVPMEKPFFLQEYRDGRVGPSEPIDRDWETGLFGS